MVTEAAPLTTGEQITADDILPQGSALLELYQLEFTTLELPTKYRMADDYEDANIIDAHSHFDIQELRDLYAEQAAKRAWQYSWWTEASQVLKDYGANPELADKLKIAAKHTLQITTNEGPGSQNFEVFELGEAEADQKAVEVVFDTLQLIDQYSGGLMSADPARPRIALGNGIRLVDNNGGGEIQGTTTDKFVYINMPAIQEMAEEAGASFHELLAVVTVHEILGHSLERLVTGRRGNHFSEHFDYSRKRVAGEIFDAIHETITPKGGSSNSQPVREYGRIDAAEDSATSVDASVADAMSWVSTTDQLPRFKSRIDAHRRDLALNLMEQAANMALKYDNTPGFVGSELRYVVDEAGVITGVEPVRKMNYLTLSGSDAVREELEKVIAKYNPGDEFIVSSGDIV